jgi:hypothetical protein
MTREQLMTMIYNLLMEYTDSPAHAVDILTAVLAIIWICTEPDEAGDDSEMVGDFTANFADAIKTLRAKLPMPELQ